MSAAQELPPEIDLGKPSIARVYDAMLGGKDNFDVDREVLAGMLKQNPDTATLAQDNRAWVRRVVRWLVRDAGIEQFLDVGSGLPTVENTHEVAQRYNSDAVVVYVDNDPAVVAHGRALLERDDNTHFNGGDLTDPDGLFADPTVAEHLELDRPVAVLHCLTVHHIADRGQVERLLANYLDRLASGSYLAMTHIKLPEPGDEHMDRYMQAAAKYKQASPDFTPRRVAEIESLFDGLELQPPGVVPVHEWWPEGPPARRAELMPDLVVGGVGRKP